MIVSLSKDEIRLERRRLLNDDIYVLFHDCIKSWHSKGLVKKTYVELYLSAVEFANTLLKLPNSIEGIEDEIEDLEDEAEDENDAMAVSMLSAAIIYAAGRLRVDIDTKQLVQRIYRRWCNHPLFDSFLEEGANKEESRWLEGRKLNLLKYELEHVDRNSKDEESIRQLLLYFVEQADKIDKQAIKELLLILIKFNIDHDNKYTDVINLLFERLGIRSKDIPKTLPPELNTPDGLKLLTIAQEKGWLDEKMMPKNLKKVQKALLAGRICDLLFRNKNWKLFEVLWHERTLADAFSDGIDSEKQKIFWNDLVETLKI